jgi:4,5-dihydroxyphthalate decarboxylase
MGENMANLQLAVAVTNNNNTRAISDGSVTADGIDWAVTTVHASEMFWRQLSFQEFDVSEMSMSSLLIDISRGDSNWVAIPVFTSRSFFHTAALVRTDRGIEKPEDLKGKRVGVPEYQQTAALWGRGVLQHEFGVAPQDIHWFMERTEARSHGGATGFQPPAGVTLDRIPLEKSIGSMMLSGELDATLLYLPENNLVDRSKENLSTTNLVRTLFPDPAAEGARYFQKTGFYHINHGVVVRKSVLEKHPWVALNVFNAFREAKERVLARTRELMDVYFRTGVFPRDLRQAGAMDLYPYGVATNRNILETITQYSFEQGLTPRKLALEEVFAPSTLDL